MVAFWEDPLQNDEEEEEEEEEERNLLALFQVLTGRVRHRPGAQAA
jgi:hypothetical protein